MDNLSDKDNPEKQQASDMDSRSSTPRERMLEHSFLAELLQECWVRRREVVEVSRSEVDYGYDLILEARGVVRHVQLKSTRSEGKAAYQNLHLSLRDKPSGCAVWVNFKENSITGRLELDYRFFGETPGQRIKDLSQYKPAKQTRANAKGVKASREALRRIPKRDFAPLKDIKELCERLFGTLPR